MTPEPRKPGPPSRGGPKKLIGVRMDDRLIRAIDTVIADPKLQVPRTRQGLIRGVLKQWMRENQIIT